MAGRAHHLDEVAAGAHRTLALARPEQVEVAPAHGPDEADALAGAVGHDQALAFEQTDAELRAAVAQRGPGLRDFAFVELVVTGDEDRRHRPAAKLFQAGPGAVDVAGEHEQFGVGRRCRLEDFGFEVEVGKELEPHASAAEIPGQRRAAKGREEARSVTLSGPSFSPGAKPMASRGSHQAPWHCLNFLPLPHGHASLRPTFGVSRLTVSTL